MKKVLIIIGIIIGLQVSVVAINILQNGSQEWDDRSISEILGKAAERATAADIDKLSKSDVLQLFYAAEAPRFSEMKGEFKAKLVKTGLMYPMNYFYAHTLMGPGHWEAKAFFPFEDEKGWGYNLFSKVENGNSVFKRIMKMHTHIGPSRFDNKDSFHLVYAAYNGGLNHSMRDEIRKINETLYLGFGCLAWSLDMMNPCPFVLYGNPSEWVGPYIGG